MTTLLSSVGSRHPSTFTPPASQSSSNTSRNFMSSNHVPNTTTQDIEKQQYYHNNIATPPSSINSSFQTARPAQSSASNNPFLTPTSSAAGTVPPSGALEDHDMENSFPSGMSGDNDAQMEGMENSFGKRRQDVSVEEYHDNNRPGSPGGAAKRVRIGGEQSHMPSVEEILRDSAVGPLYRVCERRWCPRFIPLGRHWDKLGTLYFV